ncbi:MAG: 3-deoxy-7-phosphoheptulonate synthase [Spirochaetes bacterium]|jgi:3-deoxy-7-phosphoheptulonate synthase|nr:3-deoxy-7-phosphoheptulonate synthase [Spirochaetota bacterium]
MVVVLNRSIRTDDQDRIREFLQTRGFKVREIVGEEETIFGAVGQASIDLREVEVLPGVERVIPISKPYKLASREMKREDTLVRVGQLRVGGGRIAVIAGPCAVESREQVMETAGAVRESGAVMLRGGAFKPRTSPYSFQGLGEEGLRYLKEAGEATGMPVVSEIMATDQVEVMRDYVDVLQIGARNMQNFDLLKRVGAETRPVVLKRGIAATIEEWLMAAEYLLAHGAEDVILCERGIRTFEPYTRNSLDISSIPVVKKLSHLPIIVDPSHATGLREQVPPVALAAVAAGADGLMVEVHPQPEQALSDGPQTLFPQQFERLMRDIEAMSPVVEKELLQLPHTAVRDAATVVPSGAEPAADAGARGVAFQGQRGAYSEMALSRYFQHGEVTRQPSATFRDVFQAVLDGTVQYGIVPIENSLTGSVHENYDLFLQFPDVRIVGETMIRIRHSLIGRPGSTIDDVRRVYSHPQALAQCSRFLENYPDWQQIPFYDTAGSVEHIMTDGHSGDAAIANVDAVHPYGARVLQEDIETNPQNYTRFFVLARQENADVEAPQKASVVFSTPDRPGALSECMQRLSERSVNMKKLESRPILGKPWHYMFYLDMELPPEMETFDAALEDLDRESEGLRVLGTYRASARTV